MLQYAAMSAERFHRLRSTHLFSGVDDDALRAIVERFEARDYPAGETIFRERDLPDLFHIIHRGKVALTRRGRDAEVPVATLEEGDYFGEMGVVSGRRRNATARALNAVTLLCLSRSAFEDLLARHPSIKSNLELSLRTRALIRRRRFKWIGDEEVIYLASLKHVVRLYQMLALPILLALGVLSLAVAAWHFNVPAAGWALGPVLGLTALWIVWNYVDWGNDYYILTNRRIVFLEKIVGIYDSRTEAPLWSIRAVKVSTTAESRALGYGDVTVQTISGPIAFQTVPRPEEMARLIEEHWGRIKTRQRDSDDEALRAAIRRSLFRQTATPPAPAPPAASAPTETRREAWLARFARHFSFSLRFERGDSVVYRKHWFALVRAIGWPSVALAFLAGMAGLEAAGAIPPILETMTVGLLCGELILALPILGWWWYQYEDWSNDIYQVTRDQIIDRTKKPFGAESRKVAPLDNILSARLDQHGVWALLFNYGDVVIQTGGAAGEMRFENVFDPSGVQQDVYRRLEMFQANRARAAAQTRRDEAVDWVTAYHRVVGEYQEQWKKQQGSGES